MTRIVISSGHGLHIRGASGSPVPPQLDEVDEARKVVEAVADNLRAAGVEVKTFHDDTSHDQNTNLNTIVNYHNKQSRDLDVSVHFNAFDHSAHGCEVLWVTQEALAKKVCDAICAAGHFTNRGAKYRSDLFVLNNTDEPAILIETCFCDHTGDSNAYNERFDAICTAIAESISGMEVPGEPVEPPIEPPPVEPPDHPPPLDIGKNRVDITSATQGDVEIMFNGVVVSGDPTTPNKLIVTMETEGDVVVTINGEDFHSPFPVNPSEPQPPLAQRPTLRIGDTGPDVATVQTCLSVEADGDFGPQTETAVMDFQQQQRLDVDGVVGPDTWAALEREYNLPAYEPPVPPEMFPPLSPEQVSAITSLAAVSPIASYNWKDRGRAPEGYTKGMAVAYGMVYLKYLAGDSSAIEMAKANTGNDDKDALSWYNSNFTNLGMNNDVAGVDTLRHLFVLLMGLGMRESSGQHCEGRDQSASNTSSDTCEAGLFQQSWNSHTCSPEIPKLFDEYSPGLDADPPQCALSIFEEDVTCSSSSWENYGSGTGRDFQELCKTCPQFCVEACAVGLRNLRQHWGPINNRAAEIRSEADMLFIGVEEILAPPSV